MDFDTHTPFYKKEPYGKPYISITQPRNSSYKVLTPLQKKELYDNPYTSLTQPRNSTCESTPEDYIELNEKAGTQPNSSRKPYFTLNQDKVVSSLVDSRSTQSLGTALQDSKWDVAKKKLKENGYFDKNLNYKAIQSLIGGAKLKFKIKNLGPEIDELRH